MAEPRRYYVDFKRVSIVTETVLATSAAEAIRLVRDGSGERVEFDVDGTRGPYGFTATPESIPDDEDQRSQVTGAPDHG